MVKINQTAICPFDYRSMTKAELLCAPHARHPGFVVGELAKGLALCDTHYRKTLLTCTSGLSACFIWPTGVTTNW
jgi:hypothetical protein